MTIDIARALDALVPGCEYRITDNEYDKIDWFNTNSASCPTKEAVDAKLAISTPSTVPLIVILPDMSKPDEFILKISVYVVSLFLISNDKL